VIKMLTRVSNMVTQQNEMLRYHLACQTIVRHIQAYVTRRKMALQAITSGLQTMVTRRNRGLRRLQTTVAQRRFDRQQRELLAAARKNEDLARITALSTKAGAVAAQLDTDKLADQEEKLAAEREKNRQLVEESANGRRLLGRRSAMTALDKTMGKEVGLKDAMRMHLATSMQRCDVEDVNSPLVGNDVSKMRMGGSSATAIGLPALLKVDLFVLFRKLSNGVGAIAEEVHEHGTIEDKECLSYVLSQRAGTSAQTFKNSPFARDCDAEGVRADRKAASGEGMVLDDFVNHKASKMAQLDAAHVLALRLYSTAAFRSLNGPLREWQRKTAHPFAATVLFLADGIKRLRAVEAERSTHGSTEDEAEDQSLDLWRGMRNLGAADKFLKLGGSEPGLMSTTSDLAVAVRYGISSHSLLFKLRTTSFMNRGADISFLSAFPGEKEYLYPPLTYLSPTGLCEEVVFHPEELKNLNVAIPVDGAIRFTVIEVEPQMA